MLKFPISKQSVVLHISITINCISLNSRLVKGYLKLQQCCWKINCLFYFLFSALVSITNARNISFQDFFGQLSFVLFTSEKKITNMSPLMGLKVQYTYQAT